MMQDPTFWVAVGFAVFIVGIIYLKLPAMIGKALDERGAKIRSELEQARKLREDAQALFVDYQRRQREAQKEAEEIVAHAKAEAARMLTEAEADIAASIVRRRKLAETKIAQAEATALKEVREAAVDLAIAGATAVLKTQMQGPAGQTTMDKAIADIGRHLH